MSGFGGGEGTDRLGDQVPRHLVLPAAFTAAAPIAPLGNHTFGPYDFRGAHQGAYDTICGVIIADRDFSLYINQGSTNVDLDDRIQLDSTLQPSGRYAVEIREPVLGYWGNFIVHNNDAGNPITALTGQIYLMPVAQITSLPTGAATEATLKKIQERTDYETVLDACEAVGGWAGNAQVANLATTTNHVRGERALTFDKVAGGVTAQIEQTLAAGVDFTLYKDNDLIGLIFYLSNIAAVDYVYLRLGTNAGNCSEWRINDEDITAAEWMSAKMALSGVEPTVIGNGCGNTINYVAFGVVFDAAGDLLADIRLDSVVLITSQHSTAQLNAEISTEISSPNINVARVGDTPVSTDSGAPDAGSQRIVSTVHDGVGAPALDADPLPVEIGDGINQLDIALRAVASVANGIIKMLEYNAVLPVVADGQTVPGQASAYGREEGAAHNRPLGADQHIDIAPVLYDPMTVAARASAALPAAGAYDATPTEIPTGGRKRLLVDFQYDEDPGAANGRGKYQVWLCITDGTAVDQWGPISSGEQQPTVQGANTETWIQAAEYEFDPTAATNEGIQRLYDITGAHKIRIPACESGDVANPGTCRIDARFDN